MIWNPQTDADHHPESYSCCSANFPKSVRQINKHHGNQYAVTDTNLDAVT